jgi:hypothetical protein
MKILGSVAIVHSSDRDASVRRFVALFGAPPLHEFPVEGRDLNVSVFPGISVLSGSASALAPFSTLRASVFVSSISEAEEELTAGGWTTEGPLGTGAGLLARDPDGNLLEFVENPDLPA